MLNQWPNILVDPFTLNPLRTPSSRGAMIQESDAEAPSEIKVL
jgi:hypothetical protein